MHRPIGTSFTNYIYRYTTHYLPYSSQSYQHRQKFKKWNRISNQTDFLLMSSATILSPQSQETQPKDLQKLSYKYQRIDTKCCYYASDLSVEKRERLLRRSLLHQPDMLMQSPFDTSHWYYLLCTVVILYTLHSNSVLIILYHTVTS